jgi:putative DNA primase/helicase
MIANHQIVDQFRYAMEQYGIRCESDIKPDMGKITRFTVAGDRRNSMTGWYVLHTDGVPAGEFGCWKRGIQSTWCAKSENTLTADERAAIAKRRADSEKQRSDEEKIRHDAAAEQAHIVWDAAEDATTHPYLIRKQVPAYGLRVGKWTRVDDYGEIWMREDNALLVPIRNGRKLVSLQAILPSKNDAISRDKDFMPGGKKRGCFHLIGNADGNHNTLVVCEGYATGASIHLATGNAVAVAFDAGNLKPVAERFRAKYPKHKIIIAADNDQWTKEPVNNPGVTRAREAAAAVRARVVIPEFYDTTSHPTDFNDLHVLEGIDALQEAFAEQVTTTDIVPATSTGEVSSVDWFSPFPDINGKGKPLSTIENMQEACRRLGVTVRYNVINKEMEILIPGEGFSVDNQANASLAWLTSACIRFGMTTGNIGDFLCYMADQNQYNPVAEWIISKPWDGVDRLKLLLGTIVAEGECDDMNVLDMKDALIKRWMLSACAAAFRPSGVSAHGILVLQGGQYLGKTKWFKSLVPESMGVIQDGLILRPDDRDSVKQALSYWLVELGELDATFRKSDIAQLKSFITRDRDTLRRAYAKLESHYARRTVFFASVNPRQFLHDPTGNRRYWTISCESINHDHRLDMQQVWAQVYQTMYATGETWYLTPQEMDMLNGHNRDFEVLDPVKEKLLTMYDWSVPKTLWRYMTATDVMQEIGFDKPTRSELTHCGQILQELNGNTRKRSSGRQLSGIPHAIR